MQGNDHMVMKVPKQEIAQLATVPAVATTPRLEGQREEVVQQKAGQVTQQSAGPCVSVWSEPEPRKRSSSWQRPSKAKREVMASLVSRMPTPPSKLRRVSPIGQTQPAASCHSNLGNQLWGQPLSCTELQGRGKEWSRGRQAQDQPTKPVEGRLLKGYHLKGKARQRGGSI